jgi:hypothetical protein
MEENLSLWQGRQNNKETDESNTFKIGADTTEKYVFKHETIFLVLQEIII